MQSAPDPTDSPRSGSNHPQPHAARRSASTSVWTVVGFGLVGLAIVAVVASRLRREPAALANADTERGVRSVRSIRPEILQEAKLTLPANIEGFQSTALHSRVNGYLRQWQADLGDRVKQGQVLAEIDTPELDQELEEARAKLTQGQADLETAKAALAEAQCSLKEAEADVARAKANLDYSRGVLGRNTALSQQRVIAQQEFDDSHRDSMARQADSEAAEAQHRTRQSHLATQSAMIRSREAAVSSLTATVRRLEEMQRFKRIVAPFDGIVVRRRAEVGMLVTAGNPQSSQELFALVQPDRLRIKIHVPQAYAPSIAAGQPAEVLSPEYPNRIFPARIARTARAIDPAGRTLAVELELDNPDASLLPGAFAQVILTTRRAEPTPTVPIYSLLTRKDGAQVAVLDAGNVVRLRKVQLGRDYGRKVEVLTGLRGDESLVINPPDDLRDGEAVRLAENNDEPKQAGG